jgi:hypothetical protein
MKQNVTNKLQTLIVKEKSQKERTTTYKIKRDIQEKNLINNVK